MSGEAKTPPRNVLPDLIIPATALGFTVYYLTTITEVPWISQASAVTVGSLLTLTIVVYAIRTAWRIKRGVETIALPEIDDVTGVTVRRVVLFFLTIGYVAAIESLGFTITTTVFLFFAIILLSSPLNWRAAGLVAVCSSVTGYIVFIYFFETRFPRGPIENFLKGLF